MNSLYAIGDIHGCIDTFENLLGQLSLGKNDQLVLTGDLVDRGPHSKLVIDKVWELQEKGFQVHCLRGNHEHMMLSACTGYDAYSWRMQGGKETLESFGVHWPSDIPPRYVKWIEQLPHCVQIENFLFVHAGINMRCAEPMDDRDSMLWIRSWYKNLNRAWLGERYIIHGHTPHPFEELEEQLKKLDEDRVLNLDTGCYVGESFYLNGFCRLSACELRKRVLFEEKRQDAVFFGR